MSLNDLTELRRRRLELKEQYDLWMQDPFTRHVMDFIAVRGKFYRDRGMSLSSDNDATNQDKGRIAMCAEIDAIPAMVHRELDDDLERQAARAAMEAQNKERIQQHGAHSFADDSAGGADGGSGDCPL